jgi:hypothetical protein
MRKVAQTDLGSDMNGQMAGRPAQQGVRRLRAAAAALISLFALTACDGAREALGIDKQSPDEFAVVTRAPLSMPPDFGLRPPRPGVQRPQETQVKDSARSLLTKSSTPQESGLSRGEAAFLAKAGATNPDPNIRREIDRESSLLASEDDRFIDTIMFWQAKPEPGTPVDPTAESRRLRENAALGKAPTTGRSPTIEREPKGWLEGLIN